MIRGYAASAGDPGSNPALGKHGPVTTRGYYGNSRPLRDWQSRHSGWHSEPDSDDDNLRYQDAPDCRKWTKGGWDFPFCPRGSFENAVMVGLSAGPGFTPSRCRTVIGRGRGHHESQGLRLQTGAVQ